VTLPIVVHVEGFDDRHFLAGMVERLGWIPAREKHAQERVKTLLADSRTPNTSFGYLSPSRDRALLVNPGLAGHGNEARVFERVEFALSEPERRRELIACVDSDLRWDDPDPTRPRLDRMRVVDPDGRVELAVWHWRPGVDRQGVPKKQTLERLVLGVLSEIEGSKGLGAIVDRFLAETPAASSLTGKHFAWATMAKWYGEHGCGDFYQALWREDAFAQAMRATLDEHRILPLFREALAR
jgi:hypothetical protein